MTSKYYINPEDARAELLIRKELRTKVPEFWSEHGVDFPGKMFNDLPPSAFLARQLATFRFEDAVFLRMAEEANLYPLWSPFSVDKYSGKSSLKRSYVQPQIADRFNKNGEVITCKKRLIKDLGVCQPDPLRELVADDGSNIMAWHLNRWFMATGGGLLLEASSYKSGWNISLERSYLGFLSLFISHAVLFEDFHGGESGNELNTFTSKVFEPAFKKVEDYFGVRPLIVKLPWWKELGFYPDDEWVTDWRNRPIPGQ